MRSNRMRSCFLTFEQNELEDGFNSERVNSFRTQDTCARLIVGILSLYTYIYFSEDARGRCGTCKVEDDGYPVLGICCSLIWADLVLGMLFKTNSHYFRTARIMMFRLSSSVYWGIFFSLRSAPQCQSDSTLAWSILRTFLNSDTMLVLLMRLNFREHIFLQGVIAMWRATMRSSRTCRLLPPTAMANIHWCVQNLNGLSGEVLSSMFSRPRDPPQPMAQSCTYFFVFFHVLVQIVLLSCVLWNLEHSARLVFLKRKSQNSERPPVCAIICRHNSSFLAGIVVVGIAILWLVATQISEGIEYVRFTIC